MNEHEDTLLQEMTRCIVDAIHPKKVVLFGSRARGDARLHSDYDFLAIKDSHEPRYVRARPLYRVLAKFPVEVECVVYTPEEAEEWSEVPQAFVTTALREGIVLYEEPS